MLKFYSLIVLLLALNSCTSPSQEPEFKFRSSDRPSYDELITVSQLSDKLGESNLILLDVRLKEDFDKDPEDLPEWYASLSPDSEVVVYCVAGKWVSQKAAFLLNKRGLNVSSLAGGINAWKQSKNQ
jgi:rhodanese-related sulfurtransferase